MATTPTVTVWDPLLRAFHWLLVIGFFLAYLTEDDFMALHAWAGYSVTALLVFRLAWGFAGPRYARFRDFIAGPRRAFIYTKQVVTGHAPRYLGHNPAGGFMILLLLIGLALISATGMLTYGIDEQAGPLYWLAGLAPESVGDAVEEAHEALASLVMVLVFVHVLGVAVESWLHREDLVQAMFTGKKRLI